MLHPSLNCPGMPGAASRKRAIQAIDVFARRVILLSLLVVVPLAVRAQDVPIRLPPVGSESAAAMVVAAGYAEPIAPRVLPVYPTTHFQQGQQRVRELEGLGPAPGTTSAEENAGELPPPDDPADIREPLAPGRARRRQGEQRVRELEGLGPAPGTTSAEENAAVGDVPNEPTVAWTGELQADTVMLTQSAANRLVLGDLENFTDFRRARLGAIGSLYWNTIYRIEVDFAQNGRPTFLDMYGQLTDLAVADNVRIGHFFEPFSISRLTSNRYQTFMERPLLDAFAPARNLGVMAFSTYAQRRGTWQIGLFANDSNAVGEQQTDSGGAALTGRATFLPYWDEPSEGRYYMHVGGDFSYRHLGQRTARYGHWPGFRPGAFDNIYWPWWPDTGEFAAEDANLFDIEWAWIMGPWHALAEYAFNVVDQIGGPPLTFQAWYFETGWFLTGESRPYLQELAIFNRVIPFESFFLTRTRRGIGRGLGAWQVAFRIDYLDLNDSNIRGGRLVDLTFGLNWHLNPHTHVFFNYVHAMLDRGAPGMSYGNLFGLRAQFEF